MWINKYGNDNREEWKAELLQHAEHFEKMYDKLRKEFIFMRELLLSQPVAFPRQVEPGAGTD